MTVDAIPPRASSDLDSAHLSVIMKALANPARIDLLRALQVAHTLGEIRLETRHAIPLGGKSRPMNRVTTRQHLDRLLELGMVRCIRRVRDGRTLDHYILNQAQLFVLLEELRGLLRLHSQEEVPDGTVPVQRPSPLSQPGPKLILMNGAREGQVFRLIDKTLAGWVIGRRGSSPICLDYDPFLSLVHAEVRRHGQGFAVQDLGSRNGTTLNWSALSPDELRPLNHGDVVGAGRSAFLFRVD